MWCVITVIIGATSCCTVTSCMISEISVSVIMSMTRVSENDVMFMVLQLILLQGELLAVMAAPEEPLLIVEIWSEFASPDRGMFYGGTVAPLPPCGKVHRLSLVVRDLRHPGEDRP